MKVKLLSRLRLFVTPWTAAYQAPPSRGFYRHEYWSGVPSLSPVLHNRFSAITYFIHSSVYISIPISQFIPPPLSSLVSIILFSTFVSLFLPLYFQENILGSWAFEVRGHNVGACLFYLIPHGHCYLPCHLGSLAKAEKHSGLSLLLEGAWPRTPVLMNE